MRKRFNNIILPLYSGADEAFSRNSNTNTVTPQHQIRRLRQIQLHWRSWALRFSPFFNSAARRYYTRTSRYRTLLGLTKLASVIKTQILHQTNTSNMALLGKQQYHFDVTASGSDRFRFVLVKFRYHCFDFRAISTPQWVLRYGVTKINIHLVPLN